MNTDLTNNEESLVIMINTLEYLSEGIGWPNDVKNISLGMEELGNYYFIIESYLSKKINVIVINQSSILKSKIIEYNGFMCIDFWLGQHHPLITYSGWDNFLSIIKDFKYKHLLDAKFIKRR